MIRLQDMLRIGADTLQKAGIEEFQLDAWYLLSYCLGISRSEYYLKINDECDDDSYSNYKKMIDIRANRVPLQYITGIQEFMGIDFIVNESVLIPRQDTEILAELAIKHSAGKKVLDMCTGSGCIAISIAKLGNPCNVTATDISDEALSVAKCNAKNNRVDIEFVKSDVWDNIFGAYDIVVSNPPYITPKELEELMPEVIEHEPMLALAGGSDGLDFYRQIVKGAGNHIVNGGLIMFEIGCFQAEDVSRILFDNGFTDIRVEKDYAGLDRVVWAVRP